MSSDIYRRIAEKLHEQHNPGDTIHIEMKHVPTTDKEAARILESLGWIRFAWDHNEIPMDDVIGTVPYVHFGVNINE